jgi:hypothetical protein
MVLPASLRPQGGLAVAEDIARLAAELAADRFERAAAQRKSPGSFPPGLLRIERGIR